MNSASRGLRPTIGLRRPGRGFASAEADAWRGAPERGRFQSASKAFGQRSACTPNEFGLQGPSANDRPAPTGKGFCVGGGRRLARSAQEEADFNRRQRPSAGGRPARRMNSASRGLWPAVGLCRPGRRLASAEADAWRGAPERADFNRRQRPSAGGRPARRMNSASRGLWPVVGLRRPKILFCVGEGRRLARQRLRGPISIGLQGRGVARKRPGRPISIGGGI
jgi:hypothetical protein